MQIYPEENFCWGYPKGGGGSISAFHSWCFTHWGISVRLPIIFCPMRKYLSAKKLDFGSTRIGTHPIGEFASTQYPVHPMNQFFHFSSQNSHVNVVHYGWKFKIVQLVIRLMLQKKRVFCLHKVKKMAHRTQPEAAGCDKISVRYRAGWGGFSLYDPGVTPARGQLFAVPRRPIWHGALVGLLGGAGILLSPLIAQTAPVFLSPTLAPVRGPTYSYVWYSVTKQMAGCNLTGVWPLNSDLKSQFEIRIGWPNTL